MKYSGERVREPERDSLDTTLRSVLRIGASARLERRFRCKQVDHARELAQQLATAEHLAAQALSAALEQQKSSLNAAWMADKENALSELQATHSEAMDQVLLLPTSCFIDSSVTRLSSTQYSAGVTNDTPPVVVFSVCTCIVPVLCVCMHVCMCARSLQGFL